jgi:hypothetical protein
VTGTYYQRVQWRHDMNEDPVVLWSHVVDGREVRRVDEFVDGRLAWADAEHESDSTGLSEVEMPSPQEIGADPQFTADVVGAREFEPVWERARRA